MDFGKQNSLGHGSNPNPSSSKPPEVKRLRTKLSNVRSCLNGITNLIQNVPRDAIDVTALSDISVADENRQRNVQEYSRIQNERMRSSLEYAHAQGFSLPSANPRASSTPVNHWTNRPFSLPSSIQIDIVPNDTPNSSQHSSSGQSNYSSVPPTIGASLGSFGSLNGTQASMVTNYSTTLGSQRLSTPTPPNSGSRMNFMQVKRDPSGSVMVSGSFPGNRYPTPSGHAPRHSFQPTPAGTVPRHSLQPRTLSGQPSRVSEGQHSRVNEGQHSRVSEGQTMARSTSQQSKGPPNRPSATYVSSQGPSTTKLSSAIEFSVYPSGDLDEDVLNENLRKFMSDEESDCENDTSFFQNRSVYDQPQSFANTPQDSSGRTAHALSSEAPRVVSRSHGDFHPAANSTLIDMGSETDVSMDMPTGNTSSVPNSFLVKSALEVDAGPSDDQRNVGTQTRGTALGAPEVMRGHGDKRLHCEICRRGFDSIAERQSHVKTAHAHARKILKCSLCKQQFVSKGNLEKHIFSRHGNNGQPMPCSVCKEEFSDYAALVAHKRTHPRGKDITCPNCDFKFNPSKIAAAENESALAEELCCQTCRFKTKYASSFRRHTQSRMHERRVAYITARSLQGGHSAIPATTTVSNGAISPAATTIASNRAIPDPARAPQATTTASNRGIAAQARVPPAATTAFSAAIPAQVRARPAATTPFNTTLPAQLRAPPAATTAFNTTLPAKFRAPLAATTAINTTLPAQVRAPPPTPTASSTAILAQVHVPPATTASNAAIPAQVRAPQATTTAANTGDAGYWIQNPVAADIDMNAETVTGVEITENAETGSTASVEKEIAEDEAEESLDDTVEMDDEVDEDEVADFGKSILNMAQVEDILRTSELEGQGSGESLNKSLTLDDRSGTLEEELSKSTEEMEAEPKSIEEIEEEELSTGYNSVADLLEL